MKTPAQWKAWFESEGFARQTGYQGPLGAAYSPSGTHLRLWAPTAQSVRVDLYRKGDGTSSSLWRGDSRILSGEAVLAPVSATIFGLV